MSKLCTKCKIVKESNSFTKCSRNKSGLKSHCKECINAYNRENRKEYDREYRLNNKEKKSEAVKKCHSNKKEYYLNYAKEYYKKNKKEIQKTKNKYIKNRLLVDNLFVTSTKIRSCIRGVFKKVGFRKKCKTIDILGCSFDEFKSYIEKQFLEGMSWDNHGDWHLDHKIPISWTETEEQIYELNHYTNFQPLWSFDNLSKGNRYSSSNN